MQQHFRETKNQILKSLAKDYNLCFSRTAIFVVSLVLYFVSIFSQPLAHPSGGPYGPIQQFYDLPKISGKIFFVSPDGNLEKSGRLLSEPTTIESAIQKVKTGDAIVLRGGVYRTGNLIFNQGITIQPFENERPIFKGTFIADKWENLGNGLWTTSWSLLFPSKPDDWWRRNREGKQTPLYRFNNDMVFVDGKFLQAVGWEGHVDENTYFIDYDAGIVYIGTDPTNHTIEITAFNSAIIRTIKDIRGNKSDGIGPTIRGITFTQYAYRAIEIEGKDPEGLSAEQNHGKDVVGSTFENCTISFCSRVAGYFRGDKMVIRHCKVSDTSTEGVYILSSSDVLLEKNIFTKNNIERITGYYPAAVKIFNQCYRVTCNDNLVIDLPYSNGIWYDVGNVDGVFINNWVEGVGSNQKEFSIDQPWPSDNGFFFEISKGAICAGNVFVNCDHGIWVLNSSNVHIYNNTFINSTACIARNTRSAAGDHFGWHPSTGPDVDQREGHIFVNNLLFENENFSRPLLYVWQPSSLCEKLNKPQLSQLDYNTYVQSPKTKNAPLIWWSPVNNDKCRESFTLLDGLRKLHPEFSQHSEFFPDFEGIVFQSTDLGNYRLMRSFSGSNKGTIVPAGVNKLIDKTSSFIGAYPLIQD